jgi:hypothetical protein
MSAAAAAAIGGLDKSDDGSMVTRVFVPRLGVKKTVKLNPVSCSLN